MAVRLAFSSEQTLLGVGKEIQGALHHHIAIDELGHADAGADDVEHLLEELAAHPLRVAARQRRLGQVQVVARIQDHVVHFCGGIFAIFGIAAERDALAQVGRVLQGDLLAIVVADLIQLDDEVLEHEDCLVITDQAGSLVGLIERLEVLAQVSLRIAAADLFDLRDDVTEEVALDGFAQVAGRMLGHPLADLGDVEQFLLAVGIRFFRRHLAGQLGIAVGQANDGLHDDAAGLIEGELVGIRQAHLEGRLALVDLFDHAGKPIPVHPG